MFGVRLLLIKDNFVIRRCMKVKYIRGYSSLSCDNSIGKKSCTTYQPVAEFYAGKSVFVTGGTGFLGKVFVEKLLHSCPKLDKIYLLVRDKKGVNASKRFDDLFANPLWTRLKKNNPDYLKKVVPITGDITLPNLGLAPKDEQTLIDKVSVVYHAAATVKFNEPLQVAMNINFEGTQKILKLSQRMKNMEAFIYISTAYAHTQHKVLVETVYPTPAKVEDIYKFIDEYGNNTHETIKFLSDQPSTYTFTKSLSEAYLGVNHGNVPVVIVRPSMVSPIIDGPVKGWLDNWLSCTPLLYNVGKGWNRITHGNGDYIVDFIPVDYVSNLSIIAATQAKKSKEVQVFNSTTTSDNPITWYDAHKLFNQEMVSRGINELPCPSLFFVKSKAIVDIGTLIFQTTPARIADVWLKMTGREPKYAKLLSQVISIRDICGAFTSNNWVMRADRARELYSSLSPEDKKEFPCDPTQIEWSDYIREYCKGVQRHLKPRYTAIT